MVTLDTSLEEECARSTTQNAQLASQGMLQISVARKVLDGLRAMIGDQVTSRLLFCSVRRRAASI